MKQKMFASGTAAILTILAVVGIVAFYAIEPGTSGAGRTLQTTLGTISSLISRTMQRQASAAFTNAANAAGASHTLRTPASVQAIPAWQQVNSNGFGDAQNDEVSALAVFNGYLYAGTSNATDGALIYRSPDGLIWNAVIEPGFGIPHDTAPPAILDLEVFNGQLYASTGRGDGPGHIWRTVNGVNWAPVVNAGFGDPDTVDISPLIEYNGMLYAGAKNLINGAQIWSSYTGDSNSWTQAAPATAGTVTASVTGMTIFTETLYAAIQSAAPAQIWHSYGADWTTIVSSGFGSPQTVQTGGLVAFGGALYVGAGNTASGAQLWRTVNEESWEQAIPAAFGEASNKKVELLFDFQGVLYVGVQNTTTGLQLWRSTNGTDWERANAVGFGDSKNTTTNGSNAVAQFLGQLYVGTSNTLTGGELWRMAQPYGVALSQDATLAGHPGAQLGYILTVTNTGNVTDTFNLTSTGQTWPTLLSTSTLTLSPHTNALLTVTVSIPFNAADQASDAVTITAVSQGDNSQIAQTVLTSTCTTAQGKNTAPKLDPIGEQSVDEETPLLFTATARDNDIPANVLTFSLEGDTPLPAELDPMTGHFTWTPDEAASPGIYTVTIRVTDDGAPPLSDSVFAGITVNEVNDAPSFTEGQNQSVNEDAGEQTVAHWATSITPGPGHEASQAITFVVTPSNDSLFVALPALNPITGDLRYTPAANAFCTATITVTLQDNGGTAHGGLDHSAPYPFTIDIHPVNDAPIFATLPAKVATAGHPYTYTIVTADPDIEDVRTIHALQKPAWLTLVDRGDGTATLSGFPSEEQVGDYPVEIQARDAALATTTQAFALTVAAKTGAVQGIVYLDSDKDGSKDADEAGMSGITVTLTSDAGVSMNMAMRLSLTTMTGVDGQFLFTPVPVETYLLTLSAPLGYAIGQTEPQQVTVIEDQVVQVPPCALRVAAIQQTLHLPLVSH